MNTLGHDEKSPSEKRKKSKKDKKRQKDHEEEDEEIGLHMMLCHTTGFDNIVPTPTPTFTPAPTPSGESPASRKRAFDEAFVSASTVPDSNFDEYMRSAVGQTVNDEVRMRHLSDVSAVSSTGGKSLGERKYGCMFCGSIHQLDCLDKGGDPPCIRGGAFAKFIQDFLFKYDIAPDQEWRRMFLIRAPGFRRSMADRFAVITSSTNTDDDELWTALLQRRAWDTRKVVHSSNAGTSRELFQLSRASEFLFFNSSSSSSSPRPCTSTTTLSPVPFHHTPPFTFHPLPSSNY